MKTQPLTACKQYCLAAGATQGNIACTQNVIGNSIGDRADIKLTSFERAV
jgi:hypothetical protein